MPFPIDPLHLADLPRDRTLVIHQGGGSYTCVICGAKQDMYANRVHLPNHAGAACAGCAADAAFKVA